jgi:hypothetical protein
LHYDFLHDLNHQKNMEAIQEKLRQVIQKGSVMSSAENVCSVLDVSDDGSDDEMSTTEEENVLEVDCQQPQRGTTSTTKIPGKASKKKKFWIDNVAGQSGARLARKVISRAKSHGKWKNGSFVTKSRPTATRKKRNNKNKCAF